MSSNMHEPALHTTRLPTRRWSAASIVVAAWLVLQIGGLFSPGLLDDVDSVYIQIAREMLQRHDYVTPTVDGIRFFDKPPLMYWMAAASMRVFGIHDWAARIPLALGVLALLFAVYALGIRLFASVSSLRYPDRGGLYAALAMATSIGPYLYTRFYIPDILIALWMTLSIHLFLIALDRATNAGGPSFAHSAKGGVSSEARPFFSNSPLLPMLGFGAVLALSVLTKGLIGIVFPIAFVILYLAITKQLRTPANSTFPHRQPACFCFSLPRGISSPLCETRQSRCLPVSAFPPAPAGRGSTSTTSTLHASSPSASPTTTATTAPIWLFWLLARAVDDALGCVFPPARRRAVLPATAPQIWKPRSRSSSGRRCCWASSPSPRGRSTTRSPRCPRSPC